MKRTLTHLLSAAAIILAGTLIPIHAANIAEADVTTTLWPSGAPYTFFDNASTGGGDTAAATSINLDRSFGVLNVGASGSQIIVSGLGWAAAGSSSFAATRVIATITYLGADGASGGGDDVLIGKTTNSVTANSVAGEWSWVFDAPLTNTIDGVSNMFRVNLTVGDGGSGNFKLKTTTAGSSQPASAVKLSVAGSTTAVGAGNPLARKWVGGVDGAWDTSTLNWSDGVATVAYADGKTVTLDDTLSLSPFNNYITLNGTYSPSNLVVNNTAYDYHLSGGGLAGVMTLSKQGTNLFSLSMSNSYTGGTTVSGGTLELDNAYALGAISTGTVVVAGASLALNNGITLTDEPITLNGNGAGNLGALRSLDAVNPVTVAAPITLGSDARIQTGLANAQVNLTGTITDSGNNKTLTLNAGQTGSILRINTAGITVSNVSVYTFTTTAGLITFGVNNAFPASLFSVGAGLFDLNGTSQTFAGLAQGVTPNAGVITNGSGTDSTLTINYSGTASASFASSISGPISIIKNGTGNQIFGGGGNVHHTYSGTTTVNAGILSLSGDMSGVTNDIIVNNGGTLRGAGTVAGIGGSVTINSGGLYYPGSASNNIGNATILGNFTLNSGATMIATINPDLVVSNSSVNVNGTLTYGGTLVIYSIGHTNALQAGQTFRIFPPGGVGSFSATNFNTIETQPGTTVSFADGLVTVTATAAPTLSVTPLGGNVMQISRSSSFYKLQYQTNALDTGLSANWLDYSPALANLQTSVNVTNDPTIPSTFFRLAPKP